MTLGEQPLAQNPRTILMGLPDLPFMQGGLQRLQGCTFRRCPLLLTGLLTRLQPPLHS